MTQMFQRLWIFQNLRQKKKKKQVRQLIGLVNCVHEFIRNYSELVKPLTDLKGEVRQNENHGQRTVTELLQEKKTYLGPVLMSPNINKPFVLTMDSSAVAMGNCLKQYKNNILHPAFYGTHKLTPSEQCMSPNE